MKQTICFITRLRYHIPDVIHCYKGTKSRPAMSFWTVSVKGGNWYIYHFFPMNTCTSLWNLIHSKLIVKQRFMTFINQPRHYIPDTIHCYEGTKNRPTMSFWAASGKEGNWYMHGLFIKSCRVFGLTSWVQNRRFTAKLGELSTRFHWKLKGKRSTCSFYQRHIETLNFY